MSCDFCGIALPDRYCCCGRLVHGKRLAAKARDAEGGASEARRARRRSRCVERHPRPPPWRKPPCRSEIRARVAKLDGQVPKAGNGNIGRAAGRGDVRRRADRAQDGEVGFAVALAKSSKILVTGLTMPLSVWVLRGLHGAAVRGALRGAHSGSRDGHVIVLRGYGFPRARPCSSRSWAALAPCLKQQPRNAIEDAWCGLGGPLLGSVGAFAALAAGRALSEPAPPRRGSHGGRDQPVQPDADLSARRRPCRSRC